MDYNLYHSFIYFKNRCFYSGLWFIISRKRSISFLSLFVSLSDSMSLLLRTRICLSLSSFSSESNPSVLTNVVCSIVWLANELLIKVVVLAKSPSSTQTFSLSLSFEQSLVDGDCVGDANFIFNWFSSSVTWVNWDWRSPLRCDVFSCIESLLPFQSSNLVNKSNVPTASGRFVCFCRRL